MKRQSGGEYAYRYCIFRHFSKNHPYPPASPYRTTRQNTGATIKACGSRLHRVFNLSIFKSTSKQMSTNKRKLAIIAGGGSKRWPGFIAEKFVERGIEVVIAGRNQEETGCRPTNNSALTVMLINFSRCKPTLSAIPVLRVQTVARLTKYSPYDMLVNNARTFQHEEVYTNNR